jgi:hypothetical protein
MLIENVGGRNRQQHECRRIGSLALDSDLEKIQEHEDGLQAPSLQDLQRLILRYALDNSNGEFCHIDIRNIQKIRTQHRQSAGCCDDARSGWQDVYNIKEATTAKEHRLCCCLITMPRILQEADENRNEGLHGKRDKSFFGAEAEILGELRQGHDLSPWIVALQISEHGGEPRGAAMILEP